LDVDIAPLGIMGKGGPDEDLFSESVYGSYRTFILSSEKGA